MAEFLLELYSEEMPSRLQDKAQRQLHDMFLDMLRQEHINTVEARTWSTPQRLVLHAVKLPKRTQSLSLTRKGPRVNASQQAIQGFLKSVNVHSIDELDRIDDPVKGMFYSYTHTKESVQTPDLLTKILKKILFSFPWERSMVWQTLRDASEPELRWVRPLRAILALYESAEQACQCIPFTYGSLSSSLQSKGHRIMDPQIFEVRSCKDYFEKLTRAHVILDRDSRRNLIQHEASTLAFVNHLSLIEDTDLLEEVVGLVEHPNVYLGSFKEHFLELPREVIQTTIRVHQKSFCLVNAKTKAISPYFIFVSNTKVNDEGKALIQGIERVVEARLSDADFFWKLAKSSPHHVFEKKLETLLFHQKIGSQADRVRRLNVLSLKLCAYTGASPKECESANRWLKCDLVTEIVNEFPCLQGLISAYLSQNAGTSLSVFAAIRDQYKPSGSGDALPQGALAHTIALADKIDLLVSFWLLGETPTSTRDPFALRRNALGIIRILLDTQYDLPLMTLFKNHVLHYPVSLQNNAMSKLIELSQFILDRFSIYMTKQGTPHEHIGALEAYGADLNLGKLSLCLTTLNAIVQSEPGQTVIEAYYRLSHLLKNPLSAGEECTPESLDPKKFTTFEFEFLHSITTLSTKLTSEFSAESLQANFNALVPISKTLGRYLDTTLIHDDNSPLTPLRSSALALLKRHYEAVINFKKLLKL